MVPTLIEVEALVGRTNSQWAVDGGMAGALLGRILERHRSVLARHPDLVLPCVVRLGGWEEALQATIAAWRDQWRELGRGAWLRSLRPPALGLGAPVLSEYPAGPAPGRPWFSADERVVGLQAPGFVVAWDRTSGAMVPDVRPPPSPAPRYSIACEAPRGHLMIRDARSGSLHTVTFDPEDQLFSDLAELPEGDVIVGGWSDIDGVVIRLEPTTGAIRWRVELESLVGHIEISADRSKVIVQAGTHYILDVVSGQVIAHLPNERGPAALSPSERAMAAQDGAVLRVWDVSDPRSQQQLASKGSAGLVDARFSARGSLLLCDHTLYDGRSGEAIAVLPLESLSGWLWGGPARGCTEVLEDGVIEAQVRRGLSRWNARGEHQWSKAERDYSSIDNCALAFAPDGEHYAVLDYTSPSIRLCRVDDGTVLHELEPATAGWGNRIAFSLDGSRLAWSSRELDMVWDVGSAECLGQRAAVAQEAGPRLPHGYLGFREREHELSGRFHDGVFEVVGPGGADVLARILCEEPLVASPDGTRWASRRNHFVLEGPILDSFADE